MILERQTWQGMGEALKNLVFKPLDVNLAKSRNSIFMY